MKKHLLFWLAIALLTAGTTDTMAQGFPNVPQVPGTLLSGGLLEPNQGRTAIIAYHNGVLYTVPELPSSMPGSDFQARSWDITDPSNAVVTGVLGISGGTTSAHGFVKIGDYLLLGGNGFDFIHHETGEHIIGLSYVFRANTPGINERTNYPNPHPIFSRSDLYRPYHSSMFWSYSELDATAQLGRDDVILAEWDHLGLTGVVGHPFIIGDTLIFASDQSRTGVATYDISDPTSPQLLDVLTTGGPGGYWPELWGGDGRLLLVFPYRTGGNGIRVVDVTDPTNMAFVADVPLPGAECMYAQFQDHYLFTGSHKVDMRTLTSVLSLPIVPTELDTSQFALPLGNLLVTGGAGPGQGMAIWAHAAEPDSQGPTVGFHIPRAGQTNYSLTAPISLLIHESLESPTIVNGQTFIVRPIGGNAIDGLIRWTFNDSLTFTPTDPLLPDTTYEVLVPEGGITDAAGNGIEGYSFTFSTGATSSGNESPDISAFAISNYPIVPGGVGTFSVTAEDPEMDPLEYRFDFGDGSDRTAWGTATTHDHAFTEAGHYKVLAQVRDSAGNTTSRLITATITSSTPSPSPGRSTPIVIDPNTRRTWVVNPDNNSVTVLDTDTHDIEFEVTVAADPRSIALDANGNAWVTCFDGDQIDIVTPNGSVSAPIDLPYGAAPFGIVMSPSGQDAFISLQGNGQLLRYDTTTRTETGSLQLGPTPRALAMTPDGNRLFVSRFRSPQHRGEIWEIETGAFTLVRQLEIEKFGGPQHQDGTAEGMGVANYLTGLAVSPDGSRLLSTAIKMNTDKGTLTGPDHDQDNTVRTILSRFDVASGEFLGAIDIDNSDSASAVAFSPLGDYLFVTLQGNDDLLVLDALALEQAAGLGGFVTRRGVGSAPQGIAVDPTTNQLFVKNLMSRDVTQLDGDDFFTTGQSTLPASSVDTVSSESLSPEVSLGKTLFYHAGEAMSGEGYISCASCHLDGGHDGRVWDFTGRGEGLRNTITLHGRSGTGHGSVHWSANFDEIQDFEHDIRNAFGGQGFLTNEQFDQTNTPLGAPKAGLSPELDALAAYVISLDNSTLPRSPHRNPDGSTTTSAQSGSIIFNSLNCSTCHAGDSLTDTQLHDVGTLRATSGGRLGELLPGIETPTLLGLWETAPYLHDGSAESLAAVFEIAGGTLYPAESGQISPPAVLHQGATVRVNSDDTARGSAFVRVSGLGSVQLNNLDGGSGGVGAVELRYTHGNAPYPLMISINGASQQLALSDPENGTPWRFVNWRTLRLENIPLNAGPNNTVILTGGHEYTDVYVDDVTISTADDLALAVPHRQVGAIAAQDRANLLDFLRQLDGTPISYEPMTAPEVTVTRPSGSMPFTGSHVTFEIAFNRGVTGFTATDIALGGSALPTQIDLREVTPGTHYEVDVSGMQYPGNISLQVIEGAAQDLGGLATLASATEEISWAPLVDDLAPLGDEFDEPGSIATWQRLDHVEGWNADKLEQFDVGQSVPGHMRIMPFTTSWFMDLTGPLVFKEITGDFAVTMRMNVQRRNGQPGRPTRQFSLGGIMIRTPRDTANAAPMPAQPIQPILPWPSQNFATDWSPDSENYIFLSVGTSDNTGPDNIWNYEVKTTVNGNSTLYYGREGVPADTGLVTLQAIRRGDTFLLLRQHEGGDWIIENRYQRPDMPNTLQVGVTTYTDWENIVSNGMYTNSDDHARQYHHNRNVMTAENGFTVAPDLVVDVDYVRYTRLAESILESDLLNAPISAGGEPEWLAGTSLALALGNALDHPTPASHFPIQATFSSQTTSESSVTVELAFPQAITGLDHAVIQLNGTAHPQQVQIVEQVPGFVYRLDISGMDQSGTVSVSIPEGVIQGADGRTNAAVGPIESNWEVLFVDDLAQLSDEFETAGSLADWQRLNDVEGWNADKLETLDVNTSAAGHMRIMPHATSWYMDLVGPLVFKELTGDFVVTTEIDLRRRNDQPGRPTAYFSLGGIMLRAPRSVESAAPNPGAAPWVQLTWPPSNYETDWSPNGEDYLFFAGGHSIGYATDQWNIQVKNTLDSVSEVYHTATGIPTGASTVTLQILRQGDVILLLRRHDDGEWIIENRYSRPDFPDTLQVGIAAYSDWSAIAGNGLFTHPEDHAAQFQHNRNVITHENGFGANPDLVADVDYVRINRIPEIDVNMLFGAELTGLSGSPRWLLDSALNTLLGDEANIGLAAPQGVQTLRYSDSLLPVRRDAASPLIEVIGEGQNQKLRITQPLPSDTTRTPSFLFSENLSDWTTAADHPEIEETLMKLNDGRKAVIWTFSVNQREQGFLRIVPTQEASNR